MSRRELLLESCEDRILCDAAPEVTLSVPTDTKIGDTVQVTATFDNTSTTDTGFAPFIDLFLDTTGTDGAGAAVDDGVSFVSATYLGQPVTATVLTFDAAGNAVHPYAKDSSGNPITVTAASVGYEPGDQMIVLQLPFGSFAPTQPPAAVSINLQTSNLADANAPLSISARGGFQYGNDALDNPATDPSIIDGTLANASITPQLFTLSKVYIGPEDETATGPNFIRQYRLDIDVATGQTITDLNIQDLLPGNLQFVSVDGLTGGTENILARVTPSTTTPGGTLSRTLNSVIGAAGVDATLTFSAYVPRIDSGSAVTIDADSGDDVTVQNNASTAGNWVPLDGRDTTTAVSINPVGPEHTLTAKSIATQKSVAIVTDTGAPGASPGDTLEYTIQVQVSDYFAFQNLVLTDLFSDGQRFDAGYIPTLTWTEHGVTYTAQNFGTANYVVSQNFTGAVATPPVFTINPATDNGTTTVTFNLSAEMALRPGADGKLVGGAIPNGGTGGPVPPSNPPLPFGPTTATIKFRTVIQDAFTNDFPSGNPSLNPGDALSNSASVAGDLLLVSNVSTPTGQSEADTSGASIRIVNPVISKSIYAINGSTTLPLSPTGAVLVRPGDTVTYRLIYTVPTGDTENLVLSDYLPLPIFNATQVTTFNPVESAIPPAAGVAQWGDTESLRDVAGSPVPTISSDAGNNLLRFTYPTDIDDTTNTPRVVDILFTVTVGAQPFADGLFLTNQVQASENNTQQPTTATTSNAIVQLQLQQPVLGTVSKGVVGYENTGLTLGGITFTAPSTASNFSGGPITSLTQSVAVGASDLLGGQVDAGDTVRFAVVLQNFGRSDMYDVAFNDQVINPGYALPVGATDADRLNSINLTLRRGDGTLLVNGTDYTATLTAAGLISITLEDNYTAGNVTGETGSGAISRGFNANEATLITNGSNTVIATYDLTLASGAPNTATLGATLTNTVTVTNVASIEGGLDFTVNDAVTTASVTLPRPTLAKALTSTEVNTTGNDNTQATIGELVTYTLTLTVPEGRIANASIADVLDPGLAFVDIPLGGVVLSSGLTTSNTIGTGATPGNVTVTGSGRNLAFNFGTITNSNTNNAVAETITITYRAVVLNANTTPNNQTGTQLNNSATFSGQYTDAPTGTAQSYTTAVVAANNVTVVEPALGVTKGVVVNGAGTVGDAGDSIVYTITITNAANAATAYDLALQDILPRVTPGANSISYIDNPVITSATGVGGVSGANFSLAGANATGWTLTANAGQVDIAGGQTLVITITGSLSQAVVPALTLTNDVDLTWSSLNGSPGQRSTYNTASTERDGSSFTLGAITGDQTASGSLNNYANSAVVTSTITAPANTKTIVATSESFTAVAGGTERVAIGEIVRYRLVVRVPESTSADLQVVDNLPAGMAFINDGTAMVGFVSAANNITSSTLSGVGLNLGAAIVQPTFVLGDTAISTAAASNTDNYDSGTDVRFKLGNIVNNANSNGTAEFIVIEFNALVLNTTGNQNTATLNNNFSTQLGATQVGATSANVSVGVVEPIMTVAKAASTTGPVDAGNSFSYTITISNTASGNNAGPAFDVRVRDLVDQIVAGSNPTAELEFISYSTAALPAGTTLLADASSTVTDTLDLTFNRLNAGSSITITVNVQVKTGAVSGAEIENKALVTFSSLPGTSGTETGAIATAYGTIDVDLNPGTDSVLANADANNGTINLGLNAGERTGADSEATANDNTPPNNNAVRNNYAVAANAPAGLLVAVPTIDKQFQNGSISADDTSVGSSAGANVVIGETVTYDLLVTLPEGVTQDLRVLDNIPPGLRIDSVQIITNGSTPLATSAFNGSFGTTPSLGSPVTGLATLTLDFDNVTVVDDNIAANNSFVIRVVATVLNIAANQAGVLRTNTTQITFNDPDGAGNAGPAADRTLNDSNSANDPTVTIVEPTVTVAKSVSGPASPDAGDVLTYTITLTNTSGQVAYDLTLSDALSSNLTSPTGFLGVLAGSSVATAGGAAVSANAFQIVDLGGGNLVLRTASGANVDLPTGGTITLTYSTTIVAGAGPSTSISNVANTRWSSLDGGLDGDDAGTVNERNGSGVTDPAPTTIDQTSTAGPLDNYAISSSIITTATNSIVAAKTIVTTSLAGADGVVTPGEIVTYRMTITLPEGVASDLQIRDALPIGMAYVPGSIVLDTTGYNGIVSTPAAAPVGGPTYLSGTDVTFDFASITTAADNVTGNNTFSFTYQAVALDVVTNDGVLPGQTTLPNTATHNNGSGASFATSAGGASVTVVEPNLQVTNAISITGPQDAGAAFTYTITVNPTLNATSGAYEVSIADLLPAELGSLSLASAIVSDGATNTNVAGNLSLVGNSLSTTTPFSLLLNTNGTLDQVLTITLTGTLSTAINPGETVTTTTSLAYTGYPGDRTTTGGFDPNPDVTTDRERAYTGSDTESFTTPNASFSKSLFSTDQIFTTGANVAIGETVTYALRVTLPESTTPDLTVIDRLPAGLQYDTYSIVTTAAASGGLLTSDFNGTLPAPGIAGGAANGDDVTFTFGSIATTGDNVTTNNTFLILVTARVTNTLANQNALVLPNDATFDISTDNAALFTTPAVNVTVVEPRINVTQAVTSATTGIDAGDSVTYQVTINNLSANGATTDAFDVALNDVLPAGMLITSIGAPTLSGSATTDVALSGTGTSNLTGTFDIPLGGSVTFTFTAQVPNTVTPGQTLISDLNATFSSLNGTNANERTGAGVPDPEDNTPPANNAVLNNYAAGADATVTAVNPFSVAKTLINTSLGSDASSDVVIGETLTYQLAVSVMEGTTNSLSLVDNLPRVAGVNRVAYVPGSATVTNANGITINGFSAVYNSATNQLTITATSVNNPGGSNSTTNDPAASETDTFFISYQVQVANVAGNQSATTLINDVDASATGVPPDNNNAITVTVREPVLTLDKTTTTPGADGGDTVVYTLVIANTGNATAYEVNIQDTLDAALLLAAPGSALSISGGPGYATLNQSGNTASAVSTVLNQLNAGDTITITITAQVRPGAVTGDTISNSASLTYTSLPGTQTGERDGSGGVNDYTITDASTDFTLVRPAIDKLTPSDTTYAVGETVTYDILVTVPEGTTNGLIVTDSLPAGLVYLGSQVISTAAASGGLLTADFAGTVAGSPTVANPSGNTRTFNFGNVVSTADNVAGNGTFVLRVTARVDNIPANQGAGSPAAATQFSNTATLQYTDGTTGAATVTDPTAPGAVTVVEPVMSFDKVVLSATAGLDAGDTVQYQVTFANTGTATAHDVNFADTLPAGMLITAGSLSSAGGVTVDSSGGGVGQSFVNFQFTIPVGGSVTLTYSATLPNTVTPGSSVTNSATLNWSSINGADANERTGVDGVQGGGSLNDYSLTDSVTVNVANPFSVTKTLTNTSVGNDASANVVIGETLTYQIAVAVVEGTTNALTLLDTLPPGLVYVPGSAVISNANGVVINGFAANYNSGTNQLSLTATSVVNPGGSNSTTNNAATAETDTFFITYQVQVANVLGNQSGTPLTNDVDGSATGVPPDNNNAVTVTVREPVLTLDKMTTTPGTDGGDTVVYTLVIANTGNATAYDINILDTLDEALQLTAPGSALSISTGPGYATLNQSGNTATAINSLLNRLDASDSITVTITAQVRPGAVAGDTISNSASITYTSLPGTQTGERDGSGGVNDYTITDASTDFILARPTIDKLTPSDTTYAIGETVTYDILVMVPEGTTNGLIVTDNLPAGLVYLGSQVVSTAAASGGLLAADFAGTVTTSPTVANPSGNTRTFDFGSVISTADNIAGNGTFVLRMTARVDNILANQGPGSPAAATTFSNTATLQYTDGTTGTATVTDSTAPGAVTVVEPVMSFDKAAVTPITNLDAGDTVQFSLTFTNTGTSTAHEVTLSDVLPAGMIITSIDSTTTTGSAAIDAAVSGIGAGILSGLFTVPVGGQVTVLYTVTLQNSVAPGTNLTNSASITWSSIDGVDANERAGADGNQFGGTLNDYRLQDSVTVGTATTLDLTKAANKPTATIGEVITYTLRLTLNEGTTSNVVIADQLPVVGGALQLGYVAGSATIAFATPATTISGSGTPTVSGSVNQNLSFNLGTVVVPPDVAANEITITYQVIVLDILTNQSGDVETNNAGATATGVTADTGNSASVTLVEPALQVVKASDDADGVVTRGQLVTYTLTINHAPGSNATAYDVFIDDLVPAGMTLVPASITLAGAGGTTGLSGGATGATLSFTAASMPVGGSVTITYQAYVDTSVAPGANIDNNARIYWDSLPVDDTNTVRDGGTDGTPDRDYGATPSVIEAPAATTDPAQDSERLTVGTASLGDYVWYDIDADGVQDAPEQGLSGVTVYLDLDGDTVQDATEPSAVTNAAGLYQINGLAPGTYTARVVGSTLPVGAIQTYDLNGALDNTATATVTAGQQRTDVDFGYRGSGSISDFVWEDLNGNGRQDGGEGGLNGVTVTLQDSTGAVLATTTTAGGGGYAFNNLLPSASFRDYRVVFTAPGGMVFTTQDSAVATDANDSDADVATGRTALITLGNGESRTTVDAGLYTPITLGDRVYYDIDGDGVQDAGEPGTIGATITATWLGQDGALGGGDDVAYTTTTGANGSWSIATLPPGGYQVAISNVPLSTVLTDSLDDGVLSPVNPVVITTTSGVNRTDLDFGVRGVGSVGSRIYHDANGDGDFDAGSDLGLSGVDVTLTWFGQDGVLGGGDDVVRTTTTGVGGTYSFTDAPEGNYRIDVVAADLPAGIATPTVGTTGTDVSLGGFSSTFDLTTGESQQDRDFGYRGTGSIGDIVFADLDADGVQDAFDVGIPNVEITLTWAGLDGNLATTADNVLYTTTTDANGLYTVGNLAPGSYQVAVTTGTLPAGANVPTYDLDGVGTASTAAVNLASGQIHTDVDFGYRGTATLGDLVWLDQDGNGVQHGQEAGIGNVTVDLIYDVNINGVIDGGEVPFATTTTDASGAYSFSNLVAGNYLVRITDTNGVLTGATATYDLDGTGTPAIAAVPIAAGQNRTDVDFGYRGDASISGVSYVDRLKDGSFDGTDTGMGGTTVTLVWDQNNNGADASDPVFTTTTAADGSYSFGNLLAGNYIVTETQRPGFGQGTENGTDTANVNLPTAATVAPINFGNTTGSIAGRVYVDNDNDGVENGADAGLPGVSVTLEWSGVDGIFGNGDDRSATVTTDANGDYIFDYSTTAGFLSGVGDTTAGLLSTGSYRIRETQPTNYLDGAETAGNASVSPGGVDEGANPGFDGRGGADQIGVPVNYIQITDGEDASGYAFAELPPSSIAGNVFVDYNGDGVRDPGEPGIPNTTIRLTGTDDLGNPVDVTVTTNADGEFIFERLRPGTYELFETQPGGYTDGPDYPGTAAGNLPNNDRITGIVLTPGTLATAYNFTEIPIPPLIPVPSEVPSEPDPKEPEGPSFVFAFDGFNNFANSNPFAGFFGEEDEPFPTISSIDIWGPAMLPITPIYSGSANPGATIVIDLYNANGVHVGSQTVIADAGGNWLANFTSVVLRDTPSDVRITQTNASYSFGSGTGHNLRTYYAPSALNPGHYLGMSHTGISDESAPLLSGLNLANPLSLGPVKYGGEFLAAAGVASSD